MKTYKYIIFIIFTLIFNSVKSQDSIINKDYWFVPSYLNVQYAGNTGFLSTCAGYYLYKDKLYIDFGYGYTPSSKAGIDLHNVITRVGYKPWFKDLHYRQQHFIFKPFFVNLTFTKQIKSNYTWAELPNYYPKGYYHQNAVRIHLDLGTSLSHTFKKIKLETYWQVTTNDVYVTYITYYFHDNWIHWDKIFSQSIGFNIIFL